MATSVETLQKRFLLAQRDLQKLQELEALTPLTDALEVRQWQERQERLTRVQQERNTAGALLELAQGTIGPYAAPIRVYARARHALRQRISAETVAQYKASRKRLASDYGSARREVLAAVKEISTSLRD